MNNNVKRNNLKSKEEIVMIESFNNKIIEYFKGDSNFITSTWDTMRKPVFDLLGNAHQADKCIILEFKDINAKSDYFIALETFVKNSDTYTDTEVMYGDRNTMLVLVYR